MGEIQLAHLSTYDGTALQLDGLAFDDVPTFEAAARREWADFYGSRACPACLAASGGTWQLWWKLSWAAVCPTHMCLLIEACPACGTRLRRGRRGRPAELSMVRVRNPLQCGVSRDRRSICGGRLDQALAEPTDPDFGQVQTRLIAEAELRSASDTGFWRSSRCWFASLKAMVVLIRLALPTWSPPLPGWAADAVVADAVTSRRSAALGCLDVAPKTPGAAAGLLLTATKLLDTIAQVGSTDALDPLVSAVSVRQPRVLRDPLAIDGLPPVLERYLAAHRRTLLRVSR